MINTPDSLLLWLNLYACINGIHLFMLFMLTWGFLFYFYDKYSCPIVCKYIILLLRLLIWLFIWLITLFIY